MTKGKKTKQNLTPRQEYVLTCIHEYRKLLKKMPSYQQVANTVFLNRNSVGQYITLYKRIYKIK
jgi:hypothetical protein